MYSKNDKSSHPVLSTETNRPFTTHKLIHDIQEEEDWIGAKLNDCQEAYESYLEAYPSGKHIHAAKRYLKALEVPTHKKPQVEIAAHSVQGFFSANEGLVLSSVNIEAPTSGTLQVNSKTIWAIGGGIIAFVGLIWHLI